MISRDEFKIMQDSARCLIEVVFKYEEEFKAEFISPMCSYSPEEYEFDRVHISGSVMRINLRFEDYSCTDIYIDLDNAIEWYCKVAKVTTALVGGEDL